MSLSGMKEIDFQNQILNHFINHGYKLREMPDYHKDYCIEQTSLFKFLENSQVKKLNKLKELPNYQELILRSIHEKIKKTSVLNVWKEGVEVEGVYLDLAYFAPNQDINPELQWRYEQNIISVMEELEYSKNNKNRIDLAVFVNGIPFALFELKNKITGQSYKDAIYQWKKDRDPSEPLFQQTPVFFAMDSQEAYLATKLQGKDTFFLPFNKGNNGGAGNPIVSGKLSTHYIWEELFQKDNVMDLINNFIFKDQNGFIIFPRYHQWDALRKTKQAVLESKELTNYLYNHSAGSGKTYTITWLAYMLSKLYKDGKKLFDTVIVLTDRLVLDAQLQASISHIPHQDGVVQVIDDDSNQLAEKINHSYPIVITTIQKFAYAKDKITTKTGNKRYAIIVDEAHSSQTGEYGKKLRKALNKKVEEELKADKKNNLSFFAFTATPKEETLRLFGTYNKDVEKYVPFHVYSMKQAIEEGFILDVLKNYTTYQMYYQLLNNSPFNPLVDKSIAKRIIHGIVGEATIPYKTPIIVEHYHEKVRPLLNNQGKAMIVADGIKQAMMYKLEIDQYLEKKGYPYQTIVAFTGDVVINDVSYTEESANGFNSEEIPSKFKTNDYHILIVANKFQTGFDEKKLVGMYIDKKINGVQAVQTLSRLNRVMNGKDQTFILDFVNSPEDIQLAFGEFYDGAEVPNGNYTMNDLILLKRKLYRTNVVTEKQVNAYDRIIKYSKKENRLVESYHLLEESEEVYEMLDDKGKKTVCIMIRDYLKMYNWLEFICSFKGEEGEELKRLQKYLYVLNRYLSSLDSTRSNKNKVSKEELEEIIEVTNVKAILQHEGNIEIQKTEKENIDTNNVISGIKVPKEEFLNQILRETNAEIAEMFPTMQETYKSFPEDMKWLVEYIEKHPQIDTFIKKPDTKTTLDAIRSFAFQGLRAQKRRDILEYFLKEKGKEIVNILFREILEYKQLKKQKYDEY